MTDRAAVKVDRTAAELDEHGQARFTSQSSWRASKHPRATATPCSRTYLQSLLTAFCRLLALRSCTGSVRGNRRLWRVLLLDDTSTLSSPDSRSSTGICWPLAAPHGAPPSRPDKAVPNKSR